MPTETLHPPQSDCGDCGEPIVRTIEDERVCLSCAEDISTCERCERYTSGPLDETVRNRFICSDCASAMETCDHCDLLTTSRHEAAGGDDVCTRCSNRYYWRCGGYDCGLLIDTGDYCSGCWESHDDDDDYGSGDSSGLINSYSYRPHAVFHGDGPVFLGLELEINTPWGDTANCARTAVTHLGDLGYLKEDSSISRGFEIVTHPMSHDHARTQFPWQMLQELHAQGCDGDDTGLHVHVSRTGFDSPAHVYRWLKLLYRNSEHVSVVARRTSDNWAAWTAWDRQQVKHYCKGDRSAERYRAINVTNRATFEVRVFQASLVGQQVMAALDLVAASVEYSRVLTVADINARGGWTWSAFTEWAAGRPEYTALTRELGDDAHVHADISA